MPNWLQAAGIPHHGTRLQGVEAGVGSVLEAVGLASSIILAVRQHYLKVPLFTISFSLPSPFRHLLFQL